MKPITYDPFPNGLFLETSSRAEVATPLGGTIQPSGSQWNSIVEPKAVINVPAITGYEYYPILESKTRSADTSGKWREIKDSLEIKMTPMHASHTKIENFLGTIDLRIAQVRHGAATRNHADHYGPFCTNYEVKEAIALLDESYQVQGDLSFFRDRYPDAPFKTIKRAESDNKVKAKMAEAYAELFQAYNLGEEIAELRESIMMFRGIIVSAVKQIRHYKKITTQIQKTVKDPAKLYKEMADAWLGFRYGIMPVVYSAQDIMELSNSKGLFRTIRKSVNYNENSLDNTPTGDVSFYQVGSSNLKVRITAKAGWESSLQRIKDLINVNPITTALTVYPWSLVVRWFINLNSFFDAYIKSFTTSSRFAACVSYKQEDNIETYLTVRGSNFEPGYTQIVRSGSSICGRDTVIGSYEVPPIGGDFSSTVLLQRETVNSYNRSLFNPTDVELVWNPTFNWQRVLDTLSFTSSLNIKALKGILK